MNACSAKLDRKATPTVERARAHMVRYGEVRRDGVWNDAKKRPERRKNLETDFLIWKPCNPLKYHKTAKAFFGNVWRKQADIWKSLEISLEVRLCFAAPSPRGWGAGPLATPNPSLRVRTGLRPTRKDETSDLPRVIPANAGIQEATSLAESHPSAPTIGPDSRRRIVDRGYPLSRVWQIEPYKINVIAVCFLPAKRRPRGRITRPLGCFVASAPRDDGEASPSNRFGNCWAPP
jgi:hypothetical protein